MYDYILEIRHGMVWLAFPLEFMGLFVLFCFSEVNWIGRTGLYSWILSSTP
jgi:hypothetical protein